jgi:hypothetical protein
MVLAAIIERDITDRGDELWRNHVRYRSRNNARAHQRKPLCVPGPAKTEEIGGLECRDLGPYDQGYFV